jgi:hypothetical protein
MTALPEALLRPVRRLLVKLLLAALSFPARHGRIFLPRFEGCPRGRRLRPGQQQCRHHDTNGN